MRYPCDIKNKLREKKYDVKEKEEGETGSIPKCLGCSFFYLLKYTLMWSPGVAILKKKVYRCIIHQCPHTEFEK